MPSFRFAPNPRTRVTARFMTRVRRELQKAYMEEKASRGVTQAYLARKFGIGRAVVCRQLAGSSNLTLRTLADYAWALERDLIFAMPKRTVTAGSNQEVTLNEGASGAAQKAGTRSGPQLVDSSKNSPTPLPIAA